MDHRDLTTKDPSNNKQPAHYKNDHPTNAVVEWAKCESVCAMCHHLGANGGGIQRRLMLDASL